MYKNASYKEKYAHLIEWMPLIIESVKKDLKSEHLKKDLYFVKKFLTSKNLQKTSLEELVEAYNRAIAEEENGEEIAEFITARWLLKHGELYHFFETQLNQITADFTALEELDHNQSTQLMEAAIQEFGAPSTYLFAVLNSVVFPQQIFQQLRERAQIEKKETMEQQEALSEKLTLQNMQQVCEREISRLTDKYEKKLAGMQKKYVTDTEGLKKQIANLQRKLQEKS